MILPYDANPAGWNFRKGQALVANVIPTHLRSTPGIQDGDVVVAVDGIRSAVPLNFGTESASHP
jgi:S1-C subfamily serine protease